MFKQFKRQQENIPVTILHCKPNAKNRRSFFFACHYLLTVAKNMKAKKHFQGSSSNKNNLFLNETVFMMAS